MDRRHFLRSSGRALAGAFGLAVGHSLFRSRLPLQAAEQSAAGGSLKLFLAGDVMLGRGIDRLLPFPGAPEPNPGSGYVAQHYVELAELAHGPVPRDGGFTYVWGDALAQLDALAPAVRIVNLETSITTSDDAWPDKTVRYRMNPANVPVLKAAGIDGCSLANNHVLDFGYKGLSQTLETLAGAGIRSAGAGENLQQAQAPAIFETKPGRVLMFAAATADSGSRNEWSAGPDRAGIFRLEPHVGYIQRVAKLVQAVKQPGDIAILSLHWGDNWGYEVSRHQRTFAHDLIDTAGIDLVHGHSSHHPRGIEIYRNKAILYGCGDLINDYEGLRLAHDRYRSELTLMYFPTLDPANGELLQFELVPMRIRNMQLQNAAQEEAEWLAATLNNASAGGSVATLQDNGRIAIRAADSASAEPGLAGRAGSNGGLSGA